MEWLNEPRDWSASENELTVTPNEGSDFWRITDYGFIHDNGHAWLKPVSGDFTASVVVTANYAEQFDQAGLMIRDSAEQWLKAGIEYVDGRCFLSVVVTRGFSDWSVIPLERCPDRLGVRLRRAGDAIHVETSVDGGAFQTMRVTFLPAPVESRVGPMCCAPIKAGFRARFDNLVIE